MSGTLKINLFYISPINDHKWTLSSIFSHMISLLLLPEYYFYFHENIYNLSVCGHEIFHLQNAEMWRSRLFFPLAMANHVICVPLMRLFRAQCTSVTDSEFIKPTLNTSSETENSELAKLWHFRARPKPRKQSKKHRWKVGSTNDLIRNAHEAEA